MNELWQKILDLFNGTKPYKKYAENPSQSWGIGFDYNWNKFDPWEWCREMVKNKLTATSIEFSGWKDTSVFIEGLNARKDEYKDLLEAIRHYKIVLLVSVVNDNQGEHKYGDPLEPLSHYKTQINEIMNFIHSCGKDGVWVQTVAETKTEYGKQLESTWIPKFNSAGFKTVYNRGSRPTNPSLGAAFNSFHVRNTSDLATDNDLIVSDTGTFLNEIMEGGIYGPSIKDAKLKEYTIKVRKANKGRGFICYTFTGFVAIDKGAMKAMGEALKA
jgi:hypothetical protein